MSKINCLGRKQAHTRLLDPSTRMAWLDLILNDRKQHEVVQQFWLVCLVLNPWRFSSLYNECQLDAYISDLRDFGLKYQTIQYWREILLATKIESNPHKPEYAKLSVVVKRGNSLTRSSSLHGRRIFFEGTGIRTGDFLPLSISSPPPTIHFIFFSFFVVEIASDRLSSALPALPFVLLQTLAVIFYC